MKKRISVLIITATVLIATGCSQEPVIVVTNSSGITLTNIVISGSGFSQRIGRLSPRETARLVVHPQGDSGVRVAFDAAHCRSDTKGQVGFFKKKGRYLVDIVIGPGLRLAVLSESRGY